MNTEEAFNFILLVTTQGRKLQEYVKLVRENFSVMQNVANELLNIPHFKYKNYRQLSPETQSALTSVASRLQSVIAPPSATTQEQYVSKTSVGTTRVTSSQGDGSSQLSSQETAGPSTLTSETDQGKHEATVAPVNNDHSAQDKTSSVGGDSGKDVGGADSTRAAESTQITTSPNVVQNNPVRAANDARKEITAAKSGFNDNRDDSLFSVVDDLLSIPGDILAAITKVDEKKDRQAENDGDLEGGSVYTSIMADIGKEIGKIGKSIAMFTSDSAIEKSKAVIKNKTEKLKKMKERIEKMKEGATKDKFKTALLKLDFSVLFADPSSENKDKKSIRDKDEEVNIAVKATKKALDAEANIN